MNLDATLVRRLRDTLLARGKLPTQVHSPAYEQLTRDGLLTRPESALLTHLDPIMEAMFLMMAADTSVAEEEVAIFRGAIRTLSDDHLRSGTIKVVLQSYGQRLRKEGWQSRVDRVTEQLLQEPSRAELAYALVAAVALADAHVNLEENDFIDQLAEKLKLSDDRCCEILNLIKDQASVG